MTIVVDASVFVSAFAEVGDHSGWASEIIETEDLRCPTLVYAECAQGLRRVERIGDLSGMEAELALRGILVLDKVLYPFEPYADRIWELRHNLTCYDAWYVALAEDLGCPLLTLDRRIGRVGIIDCEVVTPPVTIQG